MDCNHTVNKKKVVLLQRFFESESPLMGVDPRLKVSGPVVQFG